jgi:hypothetical protein
MTFAKILDLKALLRAKLAFFVPSQTGVPKTGAMQASLRLAHPGRRRY